MKQFYSIRFNKKFSLLRLLFLCILIISPSLLVSFGNSHVFAGPWTIPQGGLYVNYSAVRTTFDEVTLFNGEKKDVGEVRFFSNSVLFDYGLLNNLNIHAIIPYEYSSQEGDGGRNAAFADGRFGLKYRFLSEENGAPLSLALGSELKIPLSAYKTDSLAAHGDQQIDYDFRLYLGRYFNISGLTSYADIEGGYRFRTESTPNEVFGFAEFGLFLCKKISFRAFTYGVNAFGGLGLMSPEFMEIMMQRGTPPFPQVGEDYVKAGLGLSFFPTDHLDVGFFWSRNVYSKNTSINDDNIGISVGYKFW